MCVGWNDQHLIFYSKLDHNLLKYFVLKDEWFNVCIKYHDFFQISDKEKCIQCFLNSVAQV